MDLIDLFDIEEKLGRSLTSEEEPVVSSHITMISIFINSYTNITFGEVKQETVRFKADYYGRVIIPANPVSEVSEVKYHHGGAVANWHWDGDQEVYGLHPKVVVDITFKHGYGVVPDDIREVAKSAVKRLFLAPEGQDSGPMTRYRVGDVEEEFRPPFGRLGIGDFDDIEKYILDGYKTMYLTVYTGFAQPDITLNVPPDTDTAIFE